jgi:hypothetical protein
MKTKLNLLCLLASLLFSASTFAQPTVFPNPCDLSLFQSQYNTMWSTIPGNVTPGGGDGVYRKPLITAYTGYFDENNAWHWWTETSYPNCSQSSPFPPSPPIPNRWSVDNRPMCTLYDPETGMGTCVLPDNARWQPGQLATWRRYEYDWRNLNISPINNPGWFTSYFPQYFYDTNSVYPWGWMFRRTTNEDGTSSWRVAFSIVKGIQQPKCWWEPNSANTDLDPNNDIGWDQNQAWGIRCEYVIGGPTGSIIGVSSVQLEPKETQKWGNITSVKVARKENGIWGQPNDLSYEDERDEFYRIVGPSFDPQNSWWSYNCYDSSNWLNCFSKIHESNAEVDIPPAPNTVYILQVTMLDGSIVPCPVWKLTREPLLESIPKQMAEVVLNKKGKETTTGNIVPAIKIKELDNGGLLVQYVEPYIDETPFPYVPIYGAPPRCVSEETLCNDAWQGTHIRVGIFLKNTALDEQDPVYLIWPNIPSNVGTIVFPKEIINGIKQNPQFLTNNNTIYFAIQHRDRTNSFRWRTGNGELIPYKFVNPTAK